ncbi:MAG: hypothetical protein JJU36_12010 [Phycisphaeraceae bacterium]|nr:hypothetical protein [Phycisphaeraceae bacterium]
MQDLFYKMFGIDSSVMTDDAQATLVWDSAVGSWVLFVVLFVFIGLIMGTFWLYRREMKVCPPKIKIGLATIRTLTLIAIFLVLLGPTLAVNVTQVKKPWVIVLVDNTLSMTVQDAYQDERLAGETAALLSHGRDEVIEVADLRQLQPSRIEVAQWLLNRNDQELLRDLSRLGNYKVFEFADTARLRFSRPAVTGDDEAETDDPLTPVADQESPAPSGVVPSTPLTFDASGTSTNKAAAIREAIASVRGDPIAAIVIIGDFRNNEGDDPRDVADLAEQMRIPIHTVAIGDTRRLPDARIAAMAAPEKVWGGDPFQIRAVMEAVGMDGQRVRVNLEKTELGQTNPVHIDSQDIQIPVSEDMSRTAFRRNVEFSAPPLELEDDEGRDGESRRYVYSVRIETLDGPPDQFPQNDMDSRTVEVLSQKARVLIIAGSPTWEYRTVRGLFERDPSINLSCWLQSQDPQMRQDGNTPINTLPQAYRDFAYRDPISGESMVGEGLSEYDVIIMFDPDPAPTLDPRQFTEQWNEALETFVREGGGLLYVAGPKFTGRFLSSAFPDSNGILDVLPVDLSDAPSREAANLGRRFNTQYPIRLTADADDHIVTRMAGNAEDNRSIWRILPGIYWSLAARQAMPGSIVLMEHPSAEFRGVDGNPGVLLASAQFGSGRTMYMGFNSSWRWRRVGENHEYFDRYWTQMVRFLTEGKLVGDQRRAQILMDRDEYKIGDRIRVRLSISPEQARTMSLPDSLPATYVVTRRDGTVLPPSRIDMEMQRDGRQDRPVADGQMERPTVYEAVIIAGEPGDYEFAVDLPTTDRAVRQTRGFTVEVPRIEFEEPTLDMALWRDLAERTNGMALMPGEAVELARMITAPTVSITIPRAPQRLWDSWFTLALLGTLLTLEWAFRKGYKLM